MSKPAIYGADSLRKYISKCDLPYFKIVVGEADVAKKAALASNYDKENQTVSDVLRDVDEFLDTIRRRGGDFILWLSSKANNSLPEFRTLVEIPGEYINGMPGIGAVVPPVNVEELVAKEVTRNMEKFHLEQSIIAKAKEILELKKLAKLNEPGPLERIAERLEPYIGTIISAVFTKPIPVAAVASYGIGKTPEDNISEMSDDEQKLAEDSLTRFYKARPDATELLGILADLAETNSTMLDMAIKMVPQNQ